MWRKPEFGFGRRLVPAKMAFCYSDGALIAVPSVACSPVDTPTERRRYNSFPLSKVQRAFKAHGAPIFLYHEN